MRYRALLVLFLVTLTLLPQVLADSRLQEMASRLSDRAKNLSDEAYDGFRRRDRGNRADVEALYATLEFQAGTELFRRMADDNRPESELRDAALYLEEQLSRMDRYAFGRRERDTMRSLVTDIERELRVRGSSGRPPSWEEPQYGRGGGRLTWSGRVDDEIILMVRGGRVSTRTVRGERVEDEDFYFDTPLPRREVDLKIQKRRGRGSVDVIEKPSRDNDYTGMIRIRDTRSGTDLYQLEVVW